ncbi:MAG: hypothetical protein P4L77_14995 [Sulfuriferula sp.]|nr:hypothetical protein [Sulfuriferula sp.]
MTSAERELLNLYRELNPGQQQTVQDFLTFLSSRPQGDVPVEVPQPVVIERPDHESVVKAIKRLRATYPMLEPNKLLHDTSDQMSRHMIHSVPAVEVIDELERVFKRHYESHIAKLRQD